MRKQNGIQERGSVDLEKGVGCRADIHHKETIREVCP